MPTKTNAVKSFLTASTHSDLAGLYNHDMECQVVVAQDGGERIEGNFEGVRWNGYSDGINQWRPFRIPKNASTVPEYVDHDIQFDLARHAEAIGMTGWDWKNCVSRWVAFDFDAIIGHSDKHSQKLTPEQLQQVQDAAESLDWVTVRKSTSGRGLHIYVFVDSVPTSNHTEHAALARSVIFKMSSLTGFDFRSKVDICGGNMWVWHRKMKDNPEGLVLIKRGSVLTDIPPNWRDNIPVVTGKKKKLENPTDLKSLCDSESSFESLCSQRVKIKLDKEHLRLIDYLNNNQLYHWWDGDRHILVTHTEHLRAAHEALGFRGVFHTETKGTTTHNCFLFPLKNGSWSVRRFTPGVKEHVSWFQDGKGWTSCYYNQDPTLGTAARAFSGMEDPSGGFHYTMGMDAMKTVAALGGNLIIPPRYSMRPTIVKPHKDGTRLVVEMPHEAIDNASELEGWLHTRNKWIKLVGISRPITNDYESEDYDNNIRHLVASTGQDAGWVLYSNERWIEEPLHHIRAALASMGLKQMEANSIIGNAVMRPWSIVTRPFQAEYPGDRTWNRKAPQLRYAPTLGDNLHHPTWNKILTHVGQSLDTYLKNDNWFSTHGISTGADYLKVWIASMLQFPLDPLPYLFIYGENQETGKSTLHEALELLFSPGYQRVDHALQNSSTFNAELENAILCVVEETDLTRNSGAYNRIKDWVTSPKLSIHCKGHTPYMVDNTTHYIHTANSKAACPVFAGDTRITMIHVSEKPKEPVTKRVLMEQLKHEAADFLGSVTRLEIPDSNSRLRIPVIVTDDKIDAQNANRTPLQEYISECCHYSPGSAILLGEFYEQFILWLDPPLRGAWSKQKVSASLPENIVKGRLTTDSRHHYGNISFSKPTEIDLKRPPLVSINGYLRSKE